MANHSYLTSDTYVPTYVPMGEYAANRLLQQRILLLDGELDDHGGTRLCAQLFLLSAEDPRGDISLYINSPGGSVSAASPSTTRCG